MPHTGIPEDQLIPDQLYQISYRGPTDDIRQAVLRYQESDMRGMYFEAWDDAGIGTQRPPRSWAVAIEPAPADARPRAINHE
jgi:hypothetical protein